MFRISRQRLQAPCPDQAALHGILAQIRDLGLPLLSLNLSETENQEQKTP